MWSAGRVDWEMHNHPFPPLCTDLLHDFDQIISNSSALHVKQDKDLQQLHSAWKWWEQNRF